MSNPSNVDPENVHEQDKIDLDEQEEKEKIEGTFVCAADWNHDNLPPHTNDELFKEKFNL